MARLWIVASILWALGGCRAVSEVPLPVIPDADAATPDIDYIDTDADGLCDRTEQELGTDPDLLDSDGDGLPDLVELAMAYDPVDADSPSASQLVSMSSDTGSQATFEVGVSVDGNGQAFTGAFQPQPPIYDLSESARDFYVGALAISADPVDNVREQSATGARFGAVLGRARLRFQLRFEQPFPTERLPDCVAPHPFGFTVKTDDGLVLSHRSYLLLVGAQGDLDVADAFCLPRDCF